MYFSIKVCTLEFSCFNRQRLVIKLVIYEFLVNYKVSQLLVQYDCQITPFYMLEHMQIINFAHTDMNLSMIVRIYLFGCL